MFLQQIQRMSQVTFSREQSERQEKIIRISKNKSEK